MTSEGSVPERLAMRSCGLLICGCSARMASSRGISRPKFAPDTNLLSVSEQTTGNTKVGLNPRFAGYSYTISG